jgi:hypothetical protein
MTPHRVTPRRGPGVAGPMPRSSRFTILAPLVLLPVWLAGCDHSIRHETLEFDDPEILELQLDSGSGDITVIGDPEAESITVDARIHGRSTELRHAVNDGALVLSTDCDEGRTCAVDWTITVPAMLAIDLSTGSGDVALFDLDSPTLDVETGSGDVSGEAVRCDDFEGWAGSGDFELWLSARPRRVAWDSGSGDVELSLPGGDYDLALETGSGEVEVAGIDDDPNADALISLSTGSGDISLLGH